MPTQLFISDPHGEFQTFSRILEETPGHVHLIGDIFDRGPAPDSIMDLLAHMAEQAQKAGDPVPFDIQWGNHDILWMGAAAGQDGCIANVVRICARYANLDVLEDAYGMDLGPLYDFALEAYAQDPCVAFGLKGAGAATLSQEDTRRCIKVQKAMAIIQFKVEAGLIADNPGFGLASRNLLGAIDPETFTVAIDGVTHPLTDTMFPTVDWSDPYALTPAEAAVVEHLHTQFTQCPRLARHMHVLLEQGSLYTQLDNLLLFHACVPLNQDGSLMEANLYGRQLSGKQLFDAVDGYVRDAFNQTDPQARKRGLDLIWYLWLGQASPLFAKSKMATFELYLIADKAARKEAKNPFYTLLDTPEGQPCLDAIFQDFGMDPATGRIVCGHTPVKLKDGESPYKAAGRIIIIDGGMSSAYQSSTGAGGMVLRLTDGTLTLNVLEPFPQGETAHDVNSKLPYSTLSVPAL